MKNRIENIEVPKFILTALLSLILFGRLEAQRSEVSVPKFSGVDHSVARQWNEVLLRAIEQDYARPTVHARNLFHFAVALYDSWAVFDKNADTYLLGRKVGDYYCQYKPTGIIPADIEKAREEVMSYAAYRLLWHRFIYSPNAVPSLKRFDTLMVKLGYDPYDTSTNYSTGSLSALGNYIGKCVIEYGVRDGANEANGYKNLYYEPNNPPLNPFNPCNPDIVNLSNWQSLQMETFIDQSGNVIPDGVPKCLTPEWGNVVPFALPDSLKTTYLRAGHKWNVYYNPGLPPRLEVDSTMEFYKWNFEFVSIWAAHLDPSDNVMWDISPASIGNNPALPETWDGIKNFYKLKEGGDPGTGHKLNPFTGQPYEPQIVPRGDYTRVLAEFWADGPTSETPPGHWFTLFNYVSDHPATVKKYMGAGPVLNDLEWDVKGYLSLGGALHDVAIACWGIKGMYDYIRPVSALRLLADFGQSTDPALPNYNKRGIRLMKGYIELVYPGDSLAGPHNEHVGKIKLYTWRGPGYIKDPKKDVAGVGWILAENWWPYQRPSFVTPPFQGYISGHSTYSRAAAEVMTMYTGSAFFPGGMGEFYAKKNEYLVFEDGPSVDIKLQWATYRDASDQCSLSRIWGGIHPPVDDIPGRLIGRKVGINAFNRAKQYFTGKIFK
jgi:hypothetical protein